VYKLSSKIVQQIKKKENGWDLAITEAEKQLASYRRKIARLLNSLNTFKEAKESGQPWTGTSETKQENAATHS
jgi:predicted translin family RNA/ssDNA-binding protein